MINKEDLLNKYVLFDGHVLISFEEYTKKEYENPFRGLNAEVFLESRHFPLVSLQNNYFSTVSLMNEQGSTYVLPIYKEIREEGVVYKSAYSGVSLENLNVSIYGYVIFDMSEVKEMSDNKDKELYVDSLIKSYEDALYDYNIFMSNDFYKVSILDTDNGETHTIITNFDSFENLVSLLKTSFYMYDFDKYDKYEVVSKEDYNTDIFFDTAEKSLSEGISLD